MFKFEDACDFVGLDGNSKLRLEYRYTEPHRFYHNMEHINDVLQYLFENKHEFSEYEFKTLVLAALYHDSIYEPGDKMNEKNSVTKMMEACKDTQSPEILEEASRLIMLTDSENYHFTTDDDFVGQHFLKADLSYYTGPFESLIINNRKLFKEFQRFDLDLSMTNQVNFLKTFAERSILANDPSAQANIDYLIEYVKSLHIKVGLYAGSFDPFHAGHMNILRKAELIFDKVIIGFAQNPEKENSIKTIPRALKYHQVVPIEGYTTDFIKSKSYDLTLIRGLRNTGDMIHELNQYKTMQELMGDRPLSVINLFCDREYEHVSGRMLRSIAAIGGTDDPLYLKYVVL